MRVSEYLILSRKLYKSTSTVHLRYLLKNKVLSVDDKYDIIRKEYVLRYGRVLSRSRENCMKEMIRGPRQSHDELYSIGFSRYDIKANSELLRRLGIWKPRGYPCSGKTKTGKPCRNPSKYEGRKCHVHKTIHDPSIFFETDEFDFEKLF